MARRSIFPAVSSYAASLARDAASLASIGAASKPQEERAKKIAELSGGLYDETKKLENSLKAAQGISDILAQAKSYNENVKPAMEAVRVKADALEHLVAKEAWPFPGYEDLLFRL
jgi:glutamine synthetase